MVHPQHGVWERIAHSFDATRERTWSAVTDFVDALPPSQRVLDLMAGNGRHAAYAEAAGHHTTWFDWSRPAASIAAARLQGPVVVGDATRLPFASTSFDAVLYIAGLHGIPSAAARAASLQELQRVLAPGGTALVTVWSRDAPRFRSEGVAGEALDISIPWRAGGHEEERTYHLYTRESLHTALVDAGFTVKRLEGVAVAAEEADNWVAEVTPATRTRLGA